MATEMSWKTIVLVVGFAVAYLVYTARKTARQQIDLYDFAMLSAIAVVPALFALLPGFANLIARIAGVQFPFVVMFSMLLVVLFVFIHRLTVNMHKLERSNRILVQELGLLRLEAEAARRTGERVA